MRPLIVIKILFNFQTGITEDSRMLNVKSNSVKHWKVVEVKSSFSFDSKIEIDQVVTSWRQADETSNEKCVALYEVPTGVTVDDDASKYQN